MLKKIAVVLALALLFSVPPASAFEIYRFEGPALFDLEYVPSIDVYVLTFDPDLVYHVEYGSYHEPSFSQEISHKEVTLMPGEKFVGVHYFTCNVYYQAEYYNRSGDRVGFVRFHATEIEYPQCSSSIGLGTEPDPDYDGGGGSGGGGNSGGNDDGSGGGWDDDWDEDDREEERHWCRCFFSAPEWDDYVDLIEDIYDAIPPPPDWEDVADTFYERVVPRAVDDFETMLRNLLGTAPNPPSPPPKPTLTTIPEPQKPAQISDRGIQNRQPSFSEPQGLRDASFTKQELEQAAPTIQERTDPTGGFSIVNPIDSLPEGPDTYPIPGQTDAGEWDHQPAQEPIPFPDPPTDQPTAPENPPIPGGEDAEPPLPGDDNVTAPIPGGGGEMPEPRYKTHPDNPDGV